MATFYDLDGLRLAIRQRIAYDSTTVIADADLTKMINDVLHDVWDVLIQSDTVATEGPLQQVTTAGIQQYAIVDSNENPVYRVKRMALVVDGYSYPLKTFEFSDTITSATNTAWGPGALPRYRVKYYQFFNSGALDPTTTVIFDPLPAGVYTFEFWCNPAPPSIDDGTEEPFAIRFPVGEYIILECAIRCMARLRRDAGELMAERDRALARIEQYHQPEQRERAPMALRTKSIGWRTWH